jgi:DNA-binding LacI/PurR family transcriptional regulator
VAVQGDDRSRGNEFVKLPSKRPVTLRDVAREATVSLSAVSYVLNDSRHAQRISEPTKERIWEAAHRLGYRCDPIGRALQRGYTNHVTLLIVSWNLATSHAATAMAISRAAARHGLQLTVHVADEDQAAESFLRRSMLHQAGGVLVLWDSPAMQESFLKQLAAEGVPVIDLLPDSAPGISVVTPDREEAFFRGTRHLIELGHRQIALICDPVARQKTTLRKLAGYQRALAEAGLDCEEEWIEKVGEFGFEGGYEGFQRLNRRCPDVTGVFCINDAMALGVIAAAREAGRSCPGDLSVIGFGDSAVGTYFRPRLTTFALSSDRVAEEALALVVRQRQTPGQTPQRILIPEEMILRESTSGVAVGQI